MIHLDNHVGAPGFDMPFMKYLRWEKYRLHLRKVYINLRLRLNSARARHKLKVGNRRGLFIDCGSNLGQGFDQFRKFYTAQYFDYELFEPNPYCYETLERKSKDLKGHNLVLHRKAVGVNNEKLKFFGLAEKEGGKYSQGGSILKDHNTKYYDPSEQEAVEVEAISFVPYLKEKLEKYDFIVIKMDIEGGEYPVIESMLREKIFDRIDTMYVEFHSQYMAGNLEAEYRSKERAFLEEIAKTKCSTVLWI